MLVTDLNRPIKNNYEERVEKVYEAEVVPVNFLEVDNTLNTINNQVSNLTNGQITDTVSRDDLFKVSFFINLIHQDLKESLICRLNLS